MAEYPTTPFDRAVDRVVAETNRAFLRDPEAQAEAKRTGALWRRAIETDTTSACTQCDALVGQVCEHRGNYIRRAMR